MPAETPDNAPRPFVETTIARHLISRVLITHEERAISVFSGPWGIGKTTALDAFAADRECQCAIVKVEPGARGKGSNPNRVLEAVADALQGTRERSGGTPEPFRHRIYSHMHRLFGEDCAQAGWLFTFIFDEAQYLSREAIDMLRYWNDDDRCALPFPVGLVFVGNNEFALQEDRSGQSAISGAVRSRALFIEQLDYSDVTEADLVLFAQSRGITDAGAIAAIVELYSAPRAKRDLRNVERLLGRLRLRAGGGPVTRAIVQSFLNPA